ncbi:RNA 2',3'-cyclic phosphodiesterase [Desulfonatronovibrio magnus]|uniref:RNA 2',3'-cyclic phosphodiesterase n=1 Tax=Desulfonatronovibrio magnus TaxID=698827 RepID=UPI0005EB4F72|nr:RNA 2',3'-cyclic phosphodiesterase [Desulfonatronovibrio magnus]
MRLFIGIALPEIYQEILSKIREEWAKRFKSRMIWTRPGNWHLTLKFIGEVDNTSVLQVVRFIKGFQIENVWLKGLNVGFFGAKGQYRVAWLGLEEQDVRLQKIAAVIDQELSIHGFVSEKKPFISHLTLFRVKRFVKSDPWSDFAELVGKMQWPWFRADKLTLWKSTLTPEGPIYSIQAESP